MCERCRDFFEVHKARVAHEVHAQSLKRHAWTETVCYDDDDFQRVPDVRDVFSLTAFSLKGSSGGQRGPHSVSTGETAGFFFFFFLFFSFIFHFSHFDFSFFFSFFHFSFFHSIHHRHCIIIIGTT